jgi:hypothetical protein
MSDQALKMKAARGDRAKVLLSDPLIQEAFIKLKGDLLHSFNSSNLDDEKGRLNAWQQGQLLDKLEKNFNSIVKTGENAKLTLFEQSKEAIRNII